VVTRNEWSFQLVCTDGNKGLKAQFGVPDDKIRRLAQIVRLQKEECGDGPRPPGPRWRTRPEDAPNALEELVFGAF